MAWSWKNDWWKVALAVVATGAAALTGGLAAGGAAAAWAAVGAATVGTGVVVGSEMIESAEEANDLKREELQLQKQDTFNSDLSLLNNLSGQYETLRDTTLPTLQSDIKSLETSISGWEGDKDIATSKLQASIDTYDDLLGNWQSSYDAQTRSAQAQGKNTLGSLIDNWSNSEVMAADRGMGGSMALIANQEKQKAIAYAGEDLSLAGSDGIYGASYASMVANLHSEQSQYQTQRGIFGQELIQTKANYDNQLENWQTQLEERQGALGRQNENLTELEKKITNQYGVADTSRKNAGLGSDRLNPLDKWL